jgi:hypothetical protein
VSPHEFEFELNYIKYSYLSKIKFQSLIKYAWSLLNDQLVNAAREKPIRCKYFFGQNADFYLDVKEVGVINKLGYLVLFRLIFE